MRARFDLHLFHANVEMFVSSNWPESLAGKYGIETGPIHQKLLTTHSCRFVFLQATGDNNLIVTTISNTG